MSIACYLKLNIMFLSEFIYEDLYLFLSALLSKHMISDGLELIIKSYDLIHIIVIIIIILIAMKASCICQYITFLFHPTCAVNFKGYLLLDRYFFLVIGEVQMRF